MKFQKQSLIGLLNCAALAATLMIALDTDSAEGQAVSQSARVGTAETANVQSSNNLSDECRINHEFISFTSYFQTEENTVRSATPGTNRSNKVPSDLTSAFPLLHQERRWAIDESRRLEIEVRNLQASIRPAVLPLQLIPESEYKERIAKIDEDIIAFERVERGSAPEETKNDARLALLSLTRQKGGLNANWEQQQIQKRDYDEQRAINRQLDCSRMKISRISDYILSLDDVINSGLLTTDANNKFKLYITIAFSALIGTVIIGFFSMVMFERKFRDILFSNDSALQFVTLFSLIIAIILFGVVNILEGRELSALLGGLSGYILGRGNSLMGSFSNANKEQKQ